MLREVLSATELAWTVTPLEMLKAWPAERALMMLHSGRVHPRWARWSILAQPRVRFQFDGRSRWIGQPPRMLREVSFTHDPLRDLEAVTRATRLKDERELPFAGGWIGYVSYDLGRWIEPRARCEGGAVEDRRWPLIDVAWCPAALVYDHVSQRWMRVARRGESSPQAVLPLSDEAPMDASAEEFEIGALHSRTTRAQYQQAVQRTIEYIGAGDIFQANIAQRFTADFAGSPRGLAQAAFSTAQPWYGAHLEFGPDRHMISLSPELFLHVAAATRHVVTRPIKGTRPIHDAPHTLAASSKDAAELHMIVDLMRNDLGRACEFGSIRVPHARQIESHPTIHHGVGEVCGTLREGLSISDILRATFPGGSVTGAPKIRAMQIIDELEPVRRGPYCGAIGFISDGGDITLNIAIRTLLLSGRSEENRRFIGQIDYSAGAGIVADSHPAAEYEETLHKAAVVRQLCACPALNPRSSRALIDSPSPVS